MIRKICVFLMIAMLVGALYCPALASGVKAVVSSASALVYEEASESSRFLPVRRGTTVVVRDFNEKWAKVSRHGITGYMKLSALRPVRRPEKTSWKQKVVTMDWFNGGDAALKKDHDGYLYDIQSGLIIHIKRMGGHSHMDVEPVGKADGKALKDIGASWEARPAILYAGGKFIACSINTQPHGQQTIHDNDFDGQFCLHLTGSKTHGGDTVRGDHQAAIEKAYRWAHK